MRKKVKFLLIISILLLPLCRVSADSNGYIVKFNADISCMLVSSCFTEINKQNRLYTFGNIDDLKGLENYVEYCETNDIVQLEKNGETVQLLNLPNDELYSEQWQIQMINADSAWKNETYGNDIRVGIIDSGCYPHDDLKNNLLPGWNYIDNISDTSDGHGHGTHVSGIIAGEMNGFGIVGAAPKAKIIPLKCFNSEGNTYMSALVNAIYDAVDKYKCKIINMSWGFNGENKTLEDAVNYAYGKGVILTAAVGNGGTGELCCPAAYENVIGVGSVGMNKEKSTFSQYNKSVFVVAPGEKVKSTYTNNSYNYLSGTSQATPLVSAMAAIALSADGSITNDKFKKLLSETADDLGESGYDTLYGYGLANTENLLNRIFEDNKYYVSPINFDGDSAYVLIKNNTNSVLSAESIFADYKEGTLENCVKRQIILQPGKTESMSTNYSNGIVHYLWSNTANMYPLYHKREGKKY